MSPFRVALELLLIVVLAALLAAAILGPIWLWMRLPIPT